MLASWLLGGPAIKGSWSQRKMDPKTERKVTHTHLTSLTVDSTGVESSLISIMSLLGWIRGRVRDRVMRSRSSRKVRPVSVVVLSSRNRWRHRQGRGLERAGQEVNQLSARTSR